MLKDVKKLKSKCGVNSASRKAAPRMPYKRFISLQKREPQQNQHNQSFHIFLSPDYTGVIASARTQDLHLNLAGDDFLNSLPARSLRSYKN